MAFNMAGNQVSPSPNSERNFGYYSIKWEIENFRLLLCRSYWAIQSPEFVLKVPEDTKWIMVLKCNPKNIDKVLFILRRLDNEPQKVWVQFKIELIDGTFKSLFSKRFHCFKKTCDYEMPLKNREFYHMRGLNPFAIDLFECTCEMIIYGENVRNGFEAFDDAGLNLFSKELLELRRVKKYHDVLLKFKTSNKICNSTRNKVRNRTRNKARNRTWNTTSNRRNNTTRNGTRTILLHKAILYARLPKFFDVCKEEKWIKGWTRMNERFQKISLVDITRYEDTEELDFKAMRRTLKYLYSGNLKHVLEKPSIEIYGCAEIFDITEVKDVYYKDSMIFRSSIEVTDFEFRWFIPDFKRQFDNEDDISSPVITDQKFGTKWRLVFSPKCADFVSVSAEILDEEIVVDAYLECAIIDDEDRCHYLQHCTYEAVTNTCIEELGLYRFVERHLVKGFAAKDILQLNVRFRLTNGMRNTVLEHEAKTVINDGFFQMHLKKGVSFERLSTDVKKLFKSSTFSDGSIQSVGRMRRETQVFPIHKCILAARCTYFDRLIKVMGSEICDISDLIKPGILSVILRYIYSGILPYFDDDPELNSSRFFEYTELKDIRTAAEIFELTLLKIFMDENFEGIES